MREACMVVDADELVPDTRVLTDSLRRSARFTVTLLDFVALKLCVEMALYGLNIYCSGYEILIQLPCLTIRRHT